MAKEIQTNAKSFVIDLKELHCTIYFMFLNTKTIASLIKKTLSFLKSRGFLANASFKATLEQVYEDCYDNPGFTLPLNDTLVLICLRDEQLVPFEYKVGILCHEEYHAIAHLFKSLGLDINDDEHISIVLGNITEEALTHILK